jgi:hypothetical protein
MMQTISFDSNQTHSTMNLVSVDMESSADADWLPVERSPPFDRNLELAVMDNDGLHALVFPCRRLVDGWLNAVTQERLRREFDPTHWREWLTHDL